MSNLPYKLWLFLPLIFTHSIFGVYVAPESPNEGAGQVQITLPSGLDRIDIIDAPRDENGNVVGTFLDTIANQSTSTGNTSFPLIRMISMVMFTTIGMQPMQQTLPIQGQIMVIM